MRFFLVALAVLVLDQAVKQYIIRHMVLNQSLPVILGIFHLTYIRNAGAAFGLLQHQTYLFLTVAVVLAGVAVYYLPRLPARFSLVRWGLALQLGGAAGNAWDRYCMGAVIDYLDFRIWPVFNIADVAIVIGMILILYDLFFVARQHGVRL